MNQAVPPRGWFITGTDTGIGKTLVTAGLMEAFSRRGLAVAGMKPVASGCELIDGHLQNDDARMLRARCTHAVPYQWVNPCALAPPIAPSIALARAGQGLNLERIHDARARLGEGADVLLVEGVGGWRVPLDDSLDRRRAGGVIAPAGAAGGGIQVGVHQPCPADCARPGSAPGRLVRQLH